MSGSYSAGIDHIFMVLQDHFRPPLSIRRHWHAFHNAWAAYIASEFKSEIAKRLLC